MLYVCKGDLIGRNNPLLVAVSSEMRRDSSHRSLLECLEMRDPRVVRSVSVLSLFEAAAGTFATLLMADSGSSLMTTSLGHATFSVQAQLKRLADLVVAALLL